LLEVAAIGRKNAG
jgi:hypothetical protein